MSCASFFYRYSHHRELHSFPTRRSSDLLKNESSSAHTFTELTGAELLTDLSALATSRSEEHTSELQSQSNLVCRLLLEKKQARSIPIASAAIPVRPPSETLTPTSNPPPP